MGMSFHYYELHTTLAERTTVNGEPRRTNWSKPLPPWGFNVSVWNSLSDGVMWHALLCRACVDAEFCAILLEVHAKGAHLLHFERVGTKVLLGRLHAQGG